MLKDVADESQAHLNKDYPKAKHNYLINGQLEYFNQLSKMADIQNIPEIFDYAMADVFQELTEQPTQFRRFKYTVRDDRTLIKESGILQEFLIILDKYE